MTDKGDAVPQKRTLSDEDIEAIANALEVKMRERFYRDLGKGLWGWFWKFIVVGLILIAAHGARSEWHLPWGK